MYWKKSLSFATRLILTCSYISILNNIINIKHMTTCVTKVKYIMHNVQDYSVVYNKVFRPVLCEGWHFTYIWKTLAWQHHFTKGEVWVHKTNLISPLLFIYVSIPSQKVSGHAFVCSGVDCILIQFKCPVHHNQQLCMYVCMCVCYKYYYVTVNQVIVRLS
jgi:hypothetical protein